MRLSNLIALVLVLCGFATVANARLAIPDSQPNYPPAYDGTWLIDADGYGNEFMVIGQDDDEAYDEYVKYTTSRQVRPAWHYVPQCTTDVMKHLNKGLSCYGKLERENPFVTLEEPVEQTCEYSYNSHGFTVKLTNLPLESSYRVEVRDQNFIFMNSVVHTFPEVEVLLNGKCVKILRTCDFAGIASGLDAKYGPFLPAIYCQNSAGDSLYDAMEYFQEFVLTEFQEAKELRLTEKNTQQAKAYLVAEYALVDYLKQANQNMVASARATNGTRVPPFYSATMAEIYSLGTGTSLEQVQWIKLQLDAINRALERRQTLY
jgi:hypothetical protein